MAMRRFHKKSKLGCRQCKERRVKCDEAHPVCRRCSHARLHCSFQHDVPTMTTTTTTTTTKSSSPLKTGHSPSTDSSSSFVHVHVPSSYALTESSSLSPPSEALPDERFSAFHISLLRHFEHELHHYEGHVHSGLDELLKLYVEYAIHTPYLMDEVIAYAAVHKSTLEPKKRRIYLLEAKRMQTRALAQYNSSVPVISTETAFPMFLFSGLLGHHTIFEANVVVDDGLGAVIEALTHSIGVHRGLIAISQATWPMFEEEDRQKFIRSCRRDHAPLPKGPDSLDECRALMSRVAGADLDPATATTYRMTVETLQDRFDAVSFHDTHSMWAAIQDWLVAVPPEYVDLLRDKRPESLAILAHFAVLLHYATEHWFVGELGMRLVSLIRCHLGPRWSDWLDWPVRATMDTSRTRTSVC